MKYVMIIAVALIALADNASARPIACLNALGSTCGFGPIKPVDDTINQITIGQPIINQPIIATRAAEFNGVPVGTVKQRANLSTAQSFNNLQPGAGEKGELLMNTAGIQDVTSFQ